MQVSKESDKIRGMFGAIAHRYDLLNHTLSMQLDRWWRHVASRRLRPYLSDDSLVLDVCTGTGDLAIKLSKQCRVVGCDFTHGMLVRGRRKSRRRNLAGRIRFIEGDALRLPFADASFDAASIAFGLRNLESYRGGLAEMRRVLRPGGPLAILEFSQPTFPLFKQLYWFYFDHILPRIGRLVSGAEGAYAYLPASVGDFPPPDQLDRIMEKSGFREVRHQLLTGGVACLHLGVANKSAHGPQRLESGEGGAANFSPESGLST